MIMVLHNFPYFLAITKLYLFVVSPNPGSAIHLLKLAKQVMHCFLLEPRAFNLSCGYKIFQIYVPQKFLPSLSKVKYVSFCIHSL